MKQKDIILIYADENLTDIGVLQDYSFDQCFGDSENDFECRIQKYNIAMKGDNPITQDFILYIEFTEYGGIVDRVEYDSKSGEVVLVGRSWHGVLNSFVIEPPKGYDYRIYSGEANAVIRQIITHIGMGSLFQGSTEDSGISINVSEVRYEKAYDCIMRLLKTANAKLIMWYQDGKVHLEAMGAVNTGAFEEFDTSQTPFKLGVTYNNINDFVCMGQGNGAKRAVIHIYTDDNGGILPYSRSNPMEDSDYYTDLNALSHSTNPEDIDNYAKIMNGIAFWHGYGGVVGNPLKRYMSTYDYPNAEITTNYKRLQDKWPTKPANWNGIYFNYYRRSPDDANSFIKVERVFKDVYELTEKYFKKKEAPDDWNAHYKDYFVKETNSSTELKQVEDLPESQANVTYEPAGGIVTIDANEWQTNYADYYEYVPTQYGYEYQRVQGVSKEEYLECEAQPNDWNDNYKNYYTRSWDGSVWQYSPVQGVPVATYQPEGGQTKKPDDWNSNYGSYYMKATKNVYKGSGNNKKVVKKKGEFVTVQYAIQHSMIDGTHTTKGGTKKNYPKWHKNTFFTLVTVYTTPAYVQGTYFYKRTWIEAPPWISNKYYKKVVDVVPKWRPQGTGPNDFGGYYILLPNQEIPPEYFSEDFFYDVQDRYKIMIQDALKKLEDMADTDTLDVNLELESQYDVGDYVGGMDAETGLDVTKIIKRKIIKIKKDLLSIDYEVD